MFPMLNQGLKITSQLISFRVPLLSAKIAVGRIVNSKQILFVAMAVALFGMLIPNSAAAEQSAPRRIEVTARRTAFEPAYITLKRGVPVVLVLKSADVPHGMRFHELNIDIKVGKGGTAEARFTPETTGEFVGHCSVFCGAGHGKMILTIHVVD